MVRVLCLTFFVMWDEKKLHQIISLITVSNLYLFLIIFGTRILQYFIKWKTGNQLKIRLIHLLVDENEYIDDSFVVVISQKRFWQ